MVGISDPDNIGQHGIQSMIGLQVGIRVVEEKYTKDGQERVGSKLKSFIPPMTADATFNPLKVSRRLPPLRMPRKLKGMRRSQTTTTKFLSSWGRGGFVPPLFLYGHHTENQRLLSE